MKKRIYERNEYSSTMSNKLLKCIETIHTTKRILDTMESQLLYSYPDGVEIVRGFRRQK